MNFFSYFVSQLLLRQPSMALVTARDVTEPSKIHIRRMWISCVKSVGCGFVARSELVPAVTATAIQLSYLKLNSYIQTE